jgi:small nuclear ribonucleoprotein (snRNP)-like protein
MAADKCLCAGAALRITRSHLMLGLATLSFLTCGSASSVAETRGYAIAQFMTATYANEGNCPLGGNGTPTDLKVRILSQRGYTKDQALKIIENGDKDEKGNRFDFLRRGTIDGKPADISNFPYSAPDPKIETNVGKLGYGFNLDGKDGAEALTDPETGERGLDNQLIRALGCFAVYDIRRPVRPYLEDITWDTQMDAMPAWLMSVTGDDLNKDGDVTITFDRALNHLIRDAHGGASADVTFIVDRNPRSHSVFKGKIENGILSITEPGDFSMMSEAPFHTIIQFSKTHLRLKINENRTLTGFIGGYEPWMNYYTFLAIRGEGTGQVDLPGSYYALKRMADGIPDPKTGENTSISNAYWMELVPAYHASPDGKIVRDNDTQNAKNPR